MSCHVMAWIVISYHVMSCHVLSFLLYRLLSMSLVHLVWWRVCVLQIIIIFR